MFTPLSMTFPNPATLAAWQVADARVDGFVRIAISLRKRNRHPAQGCFSMTD